MSFHVILYRDSGSSPLEPAEVDRAILELPNTRRTVQDIREYACDDLLTGQSFRIVLSSDGAASYGIASNGPIVDFIIEYSVPMSVMANAMSTVFSFAGQLRLRIHNSQEQKEMAEPPSVDVLTESFIKRQASAIEATRGNRLAIGLVKVSREKMEYRSSYLHRRSVIENEHFGLGIHLPDQIYLLRPLGSDSAIHVVSWPDCIPMVFPQVDYVLVERDKRGLFGLPVGREIGLVTFAQIIKLLGVDLRRADTPVVHYIYGRPKPKPEVKKAISQLGLISLKTFSEPEPQDVVEV